MEDSVTDAISTIISSYEPLLSRYLALPEGSIQTICIELIVPRNLAPACGYSVSRSIQLCLRLRYGGHFHAFVRVAVHSPLRHATADRFQMLISMLQWGATECTLFLIS